MFSVEGSSEEKFLNLRSFPLINELYSFILPKVVLICLVLLCMKGYCFSHPSINRNMIQILIFGVFYLEAIFIDG